MANRRLKTQKHVAEWAYPTSMAFDYGADMQPVICFRDEEGREHRLILSEANKEAFVKMVNDRWRKLTGWPTIAGTSQL